MSFVGKISIDRDAVASSANAVTKMSVDLAKQTRMLGAQLNRGGLPGKTQGEGQRILEETHRLVTELGAVARSLQGRVVLAGLMEAGVIPAYVLRSLENDPQKMMAVTVSLANIALETVGSTALDGAIHIAPQSLTALSTVLGGFVLTESAVAAAGKNAAAQLDQMAMNAFEDAISGMFDDATKWSASAAKLSAGLKGVQGAAKGVPFAVVLAVGLQLWSDRNRDDLTTGDRVARTGVSAVAALTTLAIAGIACAGTAGIGCPLAVGAAAGFVTGAGAASINETHFNETAREYARQQEELAKLQGIYLKYGAFDESDLNNDLGWAAATYYQKSSTMYRGWLDSDGTIIATQSMTPTPGPIEFVGGPKLVPDLG